MHIILKYNKSVIGTFKKAVARSHHSMHVFIHEARFDNG